ncbi:MAG: dTMP kinase [Synergistaceae bacterium]|nr:dTMP kinase [Synergistaceae bacterium]
MFIAIEGIDGTGKSTQAARLAAYLRADGSREVVLTKEPGGWDGGTVLRELVLGGKLVHPWSEGYLFMLDRAEHVSRIIEPAVREGKIVVCERYHASTLAYQVWGRGLPIEPFDSLFKFSDFPVPDLTILLDMEPEAALARVRSRGEEDAFESEGSAFMTRIRTGYLEQMKRAAAFWTCISAEASPDVVFENIVSEIKNRGII